MERKKTQKVEVNAKARRAALALTANELQTVNGGSISDPETGPILRCW